MAITFVGSYVGAGYDGSVSIPGALSAHWLIAIAGAFSDGDAALTASGWTKIGQIAGGGSGTGDNRAAQAVWRKAYAGAETFAPSLAGGLNSYLATVYALDTGGETPVFTYVEAASTNVDPWSVSLSTTSPSANSVAIAAAICWFRAPKASDATGTWTSVLGPGTQETGTNSEQRSWYKSVSAGSVSTVITSTNSGFTDDDGAAMLLIVSPPAGGSFVDLAGDSTVTLTPSADLSRATDLAGATTATLTPAGALSLSVNLGGGAAVSLAPAGDLSTATEFAGNVGVDVSASGALSLTADLAGASTWGLGGTGNLALTASLGGDASVSLTPAGALSTSAIKFTLMYNSLGVGTWTGGTSAYAIAQSLGLAAYFPDATFVLVGANGATTGGLIGSYTADVLPEYDPSARNIIIFWEGVNSLLIPTTPAAELAQLEAFAATAQGDGFEVITATLLPIGYPGEDVAASDYNTLLRSSSAFDCMIDLRARLPQFSPVSGNPLYDSDHDSHLSDGPTGGYAVSTAEWADGINEYLDGVTLSAAASIGISATGDLSRATDLSGTTTATFGASGPLSLSVDLVGVAAVTVMPAADLARAIDLGGAAGVGVSPAGELHLYADLAGNSSVTLAPAGNLSTASASDFEGAASIGASASGDLALAVDLASVAPVSISAAGDATLFANLAGASSLSLVGSGDIDRALGLGGASGISLTAAGDLATGTFTDLASSAAVGFDASGALAIFADLQAQGAITFDGTASLALAVNMSGGSAVSLLASGSLFFIAPTESITPLADNWAHTPGISLTSPTWSQLQ